MDLVGPLPADTLFHPPKLKNFDCVFAMYHDQGLPVLKHASFGSAVNVTLGCQLFVLPSIMELPSTSPGPVAPIRVALSLP